MLNNGSLFWPKIRQFEYLRLKHKIEDKNQLIKLFNMLNEKCIIFEQYKKKYGIDCEDTRSWCETVFYDPLYSQLAFYSQTWAPVEIAMVPVEITTIDEPDEDKFDKDEDESVEFSGKEIIYVNAGSFKIAQGNSDNVFYTKKVQQCTVILFKTKPNDIYPNGNYITSVMDKLI